MPASRSASKPTPTVATSQAARPTPTPSSLHGDDRVARPSERVVTGEFDGIDLAYLDPNDEDDRRMLILAEHPELQERDGADRRLVPQSAPLSGFAPLDRP
jgi:hypothetical protein